MLELLDTLNLSENALETLENVSSIPKLHSLQVSQNNLSSIQDIQELGKCPTLGYFAHASFH